MKNSDIFEVLGAYLEANRSPIFLAQLVTFRWTFGARIPANLRSTPVTSLASRELGKASIDPDAEQASCDIFLMMRAPFQHHPSA